MTTWVLTHPARPWSINQERRWHPHKRAAKVKEWRQAFYHLARDHDLPIPVSGPVTVTAHVYLKGKRTMDAGNCLPAVKAAVDGLVDAGVLPDDTPTWVQALFLYAPKNQWGEDALILTVDLEP